MNSKLSDEIKPCKQANEIPKSDKHSDKLINQLNHCKTIADLCESFDYLSYIPQEESLVCNMYVPNGHTTSNQHGFDVDIKSIRRRPNFDEFPRQFQVLFLRNFDGRNIHVDFTYFFRCNFDGRKIHVDSTHFFNVISMVKKY